LTVLQNQTPEKHDFCPEIELSQATRVIVDSLPAQSSLPRREQAQLDKFGKKIMIGGKTSIRIAAEIGWRVAAPRLLPLRLPRARCWLVCLVLFPLHKRWQQLVKMRPEVWQVVLVLVTTGLHVAVCSRGHVFANMPRIVLVPCWRAL